jgi:hypothetical protein
MWEQIWFRTLWVANVTIKPFARATRPVFAHIAVAERQRIGRRGSGPHKGMLVALKLSGRPGCAGLQEVGSRRLSSFFLQGEMHALMTAILLRMARLDPLDANAEAKPPDGEFA